ncbi:MAG: histone deacetylase family protein [Actinobacteria bacterium]|nr:MAG: histone deacetylase family protein [Actinomycetota bacterium]
MSLTIPVVWSDECLLHEPGGEVWIGRPIPGDEVPERAVRIREVLEAAGAPVVESRLHPDDALLAVHDDRLVEFLRTAWEVWEAAGYPVVHGQDRVVPYIFPHPDLVGTLEPIIPVSPAARTGFFSFDTMTPVGPGTWRAARAAADCALTACDLVLEGAAAAYACTRPPGHHVTREAYGGSCYLNNTAIAAAHLRANGRARVAILDIDAHHGNGAQSIFAGRDDVFTASVHVDPEAGWFPHFLGTALESGVGNLNIPLAPRTGDEGWLAAVVGAGDAARAAGADALVVALGVDAAAVDPESPLEVSRDGFREGGRLLGNLGLPTVVVQEGGYDLAAIGGLVLAALEGIEEGLRA